MNWTQSDISKATTPRQVPRAGRAASAAVDSPGAARGAGRAQQNAPPPGGPDLPRPAYGALPGPCTWLFASGTVAVSLAADHFGERDRVVVERAERPGAAGGVAGGARGV